MDWFQILDLILKIAPWVIKGFLKARNSINYRGESQEIRSIARSVHDYSWENLQQSVPNIDRIGFIDRPEIEYIQEIWKSSSNAVLLFGDAGSGKSGIALRLGQLLSYQGASVLFLRANDFPYNQDPISIIQNRTALNTPLLHGLQILSERKEVVIIVDQLDTVAGSDLGKSFVSFINSLAGIQKIKLLAVSRDYEYRNDPDISKFNFQTVLSGELSAEQSKLFLSQLGIREPSQEILNLSTNLLNLSLIGEVTKRIDFSTKNLMSRAELWRHYINSIQLREGDDVADYILQLSRTVTARGERTFTVSFPKAEYRRKLLSRGILVEAPGRRYGFRHMQIQEFLCAYSFLPEQSNIQRLKEEINNPLLRGVITWLHALYHIETPAVEPIFVNDVLGAKKELSFYTAVTVLDNLKHQTDPTKDVASVILHFINDWAYHRYFFEGLDNPEWIIPFYEIGLFSKPPDLIEIEPGSFQMLPWPAGEYLARLADQFEDIVVDVVKSIKTENWRVQEILIDAMMKISPAKASELVHVIDPWLCGRFSGMLPIKLLKLTNHLLENGCTDSAVQIFEYVLTPIVPLDAIKHEEYRPPVRFRSESYWVNEYFEKQFPKLVEMKPRKVVLVLEKQLVKLIELMQQSGIDDVEVKVGYIWRLDIPYTLHRRSDADPLDLLIDGLNEALTELCKRSTMDCGDFLDNYLDSEHLIFQRIALFILRKFGQNYPALLGMALTQRKFLEDNKYAKEYQGLLRDQFQNASDETKNQVIAWILSGPSDLEDRVKHLAQWQGREATADDYVIEKDEFILYHLELIRNHLSTAVLEYLDELIKKYGMPDIQERPRLVVSSIEEPPSPVPVEELSKKSHEELQELFVTFIPGDSFLRSRESLGRDFERLIADKPERYINLANFLQDPGIRFVYIYHYLSGIREGIKNNKIKLSDSVLCLCEYVISFNTDPLKASSGLHEPGLEAAQLEVARLLETIIRSDDFSLTRIQLDRIRTLLVTLAHHSDPEVTEEEKSSMNPFTYSLNCVRGVAMHGIFHYSLYLVRQKENQIGRKMPRGFLEPEIQLFLEERLDITVEPSPAVHSVFGAYFPQLNYLSKEWANQHVADIFPEDAEKGTYWKAAWDAYIFMSHVFRDVFKLLHKHYQHGLKLLSEPEEDKKTFGGSPKERLAQHVMVAYLRGYTDFGHQNQILDLFYSNASDVIRAQGVFWLSHVLANEKLSEKHELWIKCWAIWQKRLEMAESEDVSKNTKEISEYMRWLEHCPVGLDRLFSVMNKSVKYLHDGYDAKQLIKYAAKECNRFPSEAVTLLQKTILAAKNDWWLQADENEECILRAAIKSDNEAARRIAVEVINYRGEQGDFQWKRLLEGQ